MNTQFIKKSSNAKIGEIPASNSARATCPPACPLSGKGGCYAEAGFHTRLNWDKLDSGERGTTWGQFLESIRALKQGQLWRHNVSGDLVGHDNHINGPALWDLVNANGDSRGYTYTHYPVDTGDNLEYIRGANVTGFTVNVSTNTVQEAQATQKAHNVPVVTIVPEAYWEQGNRVDNVVRCPAETSDTITCATCKLCAVSTRKDIVAFTVHGTQKRNATRVAQGDIIARVA